MATQPLYPQTLREENISRLGLFLKTTLAKKHSPEEENLKKISQLFQRVNSHPFSKKYLTKGQFFTKDFVLSTARIHSYMEAFRKSIPFENFFETGKFPLFLLEQQSTPSQKETYSQLMDTQKIESCIQANGISGARKILDALLDTYQDSFSSKQLFSIHQILELGSSFQSFLGYDLTDLLLVLYPHYAQDENLAYLSSEYRPIRASMAIEELKQFLLCLSCLKKDTNYYSFIKGYGDFLGKKIVSRADLDHFFSQIHEFLEDNILLNLLQVQVQDELFAIHPPFQPHDMVRFSNIVEYISIHSNQKQKKGRVSYAHKVEEALLSYLFDKLTIAKIQEQQTLINTFLEKSPQDQSFSALCVVLMAFGTKIYSASIVPNFQFIFKHAVFLLSEFKEDLLFHIQTTTKALKSSQEIFEQIQQTIKSSGQKANSFDIRARGVCQDFMAGSQGLLSFLQTIITVGEEDMKNQVQFVIPRDTMQKLLGNLRASRALIEKVDNYIQTLSQIITIF